MRFDVGGTGVVIVVGLVAGVGSAVDCFFARGMVVLLFVLLFVCFVCSDMSKLTTGGVESAEINVIREGREDKCEYRINWVDLGSFL